MISHARLGVSSLLWVALLSGLPMLVAANPDGIRDRLAGMDEALARQDFLGTFVQIQGEEVETHRVVHRGASDIPRERLLSLTGSARELVRERESVRCVHDREAGREVDMRQAASRFHAHLGKKLADLDPAHYELVALGHDRVAGRESEVLGIRPMDEFRYGFVFWLDRETGMPLRADMLEPDGQVLQKTLFTDIQFPERIADRELEPVLSANDERYSVRHATFSNTRDEASSELPAWVPEAFPAGFQAVSARQKPRRQGGPLHHLIVSDGLAQVSVFIEPRREGRQAFEGESRMGTVNAAGRLVGDVQLTVVGEAPRATILALADVFDPLPEGLAGEDEAR